MLGKNDQHYKEICSLPRQVKYFFSLIILIAEAENDEGNVTQLEKKNSQKMGDGGRRCISE